MLPRAMEAISPVPDNHCSGEALRLCRLITAFATAVLAACSEAPADADGPQASVAPPIAPAQSSGPAARVSETVQILDNHGFEQPVLAATLNVPKGWRFGGGVNWDRSVQCTANQLRLEWQTVSADGSQALEFMHGFAWQVQGGQLPTNPCPVLPMASAREFLLAVVQQRRPGAQVLAYRSRPEVAAQTAQQRQAAQAKQPQAANTNSRWHDDAGELEIALPGSGQMREILSTTVTVLRSQSHGYSVATASVPHVLAQRAPEGRLEPALAQRVMEQFALDGQWKTRVQALLLETDTRYYANQRQQIDRWHAREMARIDAKGHADRAAIRSQTAREIAQMRAQTHANTQATNDNIHRRTMEGIGEYNTWRDSSGNTVRSSIHGGDRVLRHGDGSYSSTRDPYFNPPGSEELQRVR